MMFNIDKCKIMIIGKNNSNALYVNIVVRDIGEGWWRKKLKSYHEFRFKGFKTVQESGKHC